MNIVVYCGSIAGNRPIYAEAAEELGAYIGSRGHGLVYGASDSGLMGIVSRATYAHGGTIHGVALEMFENTVGSFEGIQDLYVAKTFAERKAKMIELADAFIALPGGFGTLDEISEITCAGRFYYPEKEIIFFNLDGFYDKLKEWIDHADKEGFIYKGATARIHFASSVAEIASILEKK